ncbi:MAG: germination protein YpeB [Candidatus Borkfalkiaceae bacterium]|nr:germination protein YpeB [Christensenellaceae bacterium]
MSEKKFNNSIEKADNLAEKSRAKNQSGKGKNKTAGIDEKNKKSGYKSVNAGLGGTGDHEKEKNKQGDNKNKAEEKNKNVKNVSQNKKDKKTEKEKAKKQAALKKEERKKQALIKKQQKEEEGAQKRIEAAKQKQAEKEEKKKAKLAKKQAAMRKKESIKELKLKKREERLARRDALKHESKIDRRERKAKEKQEKARLKREKREQRLAIKKQKMHSKQELARQKATERKEKRATRASRGLGGWLAAVIALGSCVLVLSTVLVWGVFMRNGGEDMLSGVYQQAFYDLVGYVDNIDVNLSKLSVTNDKEQSQKILNEVSVQANLAETNLATLPLSDESRSGTVKFVNQLGDFSKYLSNKLIDGESVSAEDKNLIAEFKRINLTLKNELSELSLKLENNYNFLNLLSGDQDDVVLQKFMELQSNSVDYPQMIYDGPFADRPEKTAKDTEEIKNPITAENAKNEFIKLFSSYGVTEANVTGEGAGDGIKVFNVEGMAGENNLFAQISADGKLVNFNWYMDCTDVNFGRDECVEKAGQFLNKLGYKSVKAVWITQNGTTTYVNFAEEQNGVIIYADMIKVSVCMQRGEVYAADFKAYIECHKLRDLGSPAITVEKAERGLSSDLTVKTSRLCYIPLDNQTANGGKEKLAYEFWAESRGEDYYVYIDALTGKQLQVFKVVQTDEGTLLL